MDRLLLDAKRRISERCNFQRGAKIIASVKAPGHTCSDSIRYATGAQACRYPVTALGLEALVARECEGR